MRKLKKKIKVWLACLTRADEVWIVYKSHFNRESVVTILLVTYTMEDAIEYLNMYNKQNKEAAWMTKQIVL
jgi:hypothetical protein